MIARFVSLKLCFLFIFCSNFTQTTFAQKDSTLWVVKAGDVIPPVTLAAAGLIVQGKISRHLQKKVVSSYPNFHSKVDEFLPYAPGVISLGLASAGVKGKHSLGDQVILALLSNVAAQGVTQVMKRVIAYPRPNGEDYHSFPSGHSTTAFANATILHEEYGQRSVFYSIGGYGVATATGTLRVLNNKHWAADVLMGAAIGIGATKVVYISYPWIQKTMRKMKRQKNK